MKDAWIKSVRLSIIVIAALTCVGCAEAKLGIGPFKALSVEVGPGGVEAKGPSAGPLGARGADPRRGRNE